MDVVRKHIENLRGRIEIRSALGAGTSFFLKLPLTLAIIDGLVVGVGQERHISSRCSVSRRCSAPRWILSGRCSTRRRWH